MEAKYFAIPIIRGELETAGPNIVDIAYVAETEEEMEAVLTKQLLESGYEDGEGDGWFVFRIQEPCTWKVTARMIAEVKKKAAT